MSDPPRFDLAYYENLRAARALTLGSVIDWPRETASTNDDALSAAKSGIPHGALFGAETQSRGRGRRGSSWLSTPGAGLWFSVLLRPELPPEVVPGLALAAGLAVRAAVASRVTATTLVKWPNDVLAGGRKLCGILVESQFSGARVAHVVVGVGINVTQAAFPEELSATATSLSLLEVTSVSREELLVDVLAQLEERLSLLARAGLPGLAPELNAHDALRNLRLRVDGREGTGSGIDDAGRLLLAPDEGPVQAISSGHVEIVSA